MSEEAFQRVVVHSTSTCDVHLQHLASSSTLFFLKNKEMIEGGARLGPRFSLFHTGKCQAGGSDRSAAFQIYTSYFCALFSSPLFMVQRRSTLDGEREQKERAAWTTGSFHMDSTPETISIAREKE